MRRLGYYLSFICLAVAGDSSQMQIILLVCFAALVVIKHAVLLVDVGGTSRAPT